MPLIWDFFNATIALELDGGSKAVFRWREKRTRKVTSDTVAHGSTFRLFVVNIVLP